MIPTQLISSLWAIQNYEPSDTSDAGEPSANLSKQHNTERAQLLQPQFLWSSSRSKKLKTLLHDTGSHVGNKQRHTALPWQGTEEKRVRFQDRPKRDKAPGKQANSSLPACGHMLALTVQYYRHAHTNQESHFDCNAIQLPYHSLHV